MNIHAVPMLGLRSCCLFSTERAVVVSPPTAPSTNRMPIQGFLAVMRLNLTRPMEKPVDIKGITSAPCIAPQLTFLTALLNLPPFSPIFSACKDMRPNITNNSSGHTDLVSCLTTDSRQPRQFDTMQPCTLIVVQPALNRPLKPSVLKADLITAPQNGATS